VNQTSHPCSILLADAYRLGMIFTGYEQTQMTSLPIIRLCSVLPYALTMILLTLLLSGCETSQRRDQAGNLIKHSKDVIKTTVNNALGNDQSIQQLFAQPYIDPLTRYLEQNHGRADLSAELNTVKTERDRRCAAIAQRFNSQPITKANLDRYRAGYQYSCANDVAAYEQRLSSVATLNTTDNTTDSIQSSTSTQTTRAAPTSDPLKECYLLVSIRNYHEALKACQAPAENNNTSAQTQMALVHYALKNYDQAIRWANQAAPRSAEAAYLLGQLHQNGQGTPTNQAQATLWFQRAADMGHSQARAELTKLNNLSEDKPE